MDIFAVNCRKNSGKSWGNYTIVSSAHSIFMHLLCSLFLKFTLKFWKSFWPLRRKHLQLRILPRVVNSFSIQAEVSTFLYLRATAFDFCKVKRGKDGGTLRTMSGEKLLKTLPVLQAQVLDWYSVLCFAISGIVVLYSGSSCHYMLCAFRLMHCWSLTVQHKTSTTGLSTVASCCSSEI